MPDFSFKIHQIQFQLGLDLPQTPAHNALPDPLTGFGKGKGRGIGNRKGRDGEIKGRRMEGKG